MGKKIYMTAPDWDAIKQDYISSKISVVNLAKKHGVSKHAASDHAAREGWGKLRAEVSRKTIEKTIEKISEKRAESAIEILTRAMPKAAQTMEHFSDYKKSKKPLYAIRAAEFVLRSVNPETHDIKILDPKKVRELALELLKK